VMRRNGCGAIAVLLLLCVEVFAGGPLMVGGPQLGQDGQPLKWAAAAMPIKYRVDPGAISTKYTVTQSRDRLAAMFTKWSGAADTQLSFQYLGPLLATGAYAANADVTTAAQFDALEGSCYAGTQSPVVFDANGSILRQLGLDDMSIIGMAGPCAISAATGNILTGEIFMNGLFQDGVSTDTNWELSVGGFDEAITHEIGHFLGLDHAQINVDVLSSFNCVADTVAGLPLMFPISICSRTDAGVPILSTDDLSWISAFYPKPTRAQAYGKISGRIYFSDGLTQLQGANVIARRVDETGTAQNESRRVAVSVVSGYRFTANPGQSVTANYLPCQVASDCPPNGYLGYNVGGSVLGSRDAGLVGYYEIEVPPGTYTIEVESVFAGFESGSSVGPFQVPVRIPGQPEFWNDTESSFDDVSVKTPITVGAGESAAGVDIILNNTPPRFDEFEDSGGLFWQMAPLAGAEVAEVQA
jgi:hypothetical protein